MKKIIIGFSIAIFFIIIFASGHFIGSTMSQSNDVTPTPAVVKHTLSDEGLWNTIQEWRASNGYEPYIKDERLCQIAELRIKDLEDNYGSDFNHDNFIPIANSVLPDGITVSENITGATSDEEALSIWLNSPSHREALKKDWKYSCIDTQTDFAVQIFSSFAK